MWTTKAIITWLQSLGITVPLVPGTNKIPDMPDQLGIVTPTTGPGLQMEGVQDVRGFQLRIRGSQNNPDDAETLALQADRLIVFADVPYVASDGTVLTSVTRSGAAPSSLSPSTDDGDRTEMVCTYLTRVMEPLP